MGLIFPIEGAEDFGEESYVKYRPSLSSIAIRGAADAPLPALAAFTLSGERQAAAAASLVTLGKVSKTSAASMTVSLAAVLTPGLGSIDAGSVSNAPALGVSELAGEDWRGRSPGSLEIGANPSLIGAIIYLAVAALEINAATPQRASQGTLNVSGQASAPALGSFNQTSALLLSYLASFDMGGGQSYPSIASLETGLVLAAEALASLDMETGDGIEIFVEIIDAILASGRGDC